MLAEAHVLYYLGGLEAMRGNFDEARVCIRRGHELFEERGHPYGIATKALVSGPSEALAGDLDAGERNLGEGLRPPREHGRDGRLLHSLGDARPRAVRPRAVGRRGRSRWRKRAHDVPRRPGVEHPHRSGAGAAPCGPRVGRGGGGTRAEGDRDRRDDGLPDHDGDALVALGRVLEAARRGPEAREAFEQAAELYARKGNVVSAGRARELTTAPR